MVVASNFSSETMRFKGRVAIRAGSVIFSSDETDIAKVVLSVTIDYFVQHLLEEIVGLFSLERKNSQAEITKGWCNVIFSLKSSR